MKWPWKPSPERDLKQEYRDLEVEQNKLLARKGNVVKNGYVWGPTTERLAEIEVLLRHLEEDMAEEENSVHETPSSHTAPTWITTRKVQP